ncbi:MAG: hypothetical protein AAGK09_06860 [Planctomycetota bacterium]
MDWRDESIEGVVERRAGAGDRLRRDGAEAAEGEAVAAVSAVKRRRKWSRVERWLREQLRRPGAWLLMGAVWLVVPAFFAVAGQPMAWSVGQWVAGCLYVGLAYHAVRRHVAFAPAVMVALGCAVSWLTVAAVAERALGDGPGAIWVACGLLTGMLGLETLRDATWGPMRLAGLAVAGGLVVASTGGWPAGWVVLVLGLALLNWDARVGRVSWSTAVFGSACAVAGAAVVLAWWWAWTGVDLLMLSAYWADAWFSEPVSWTGGVLRSVPVYGVAAVLSWTGLAGAWLLLEAASAGAGPGWEAAAVAIVVGVLGGGVLVWGWWRWVRETGDLLVWCCPWLLLVAGLAPGVWLALMPIAWLSVWRVARRYPKRRLTLMAGLVVLQWVLTLGTLITGKLVSMS